MIQLTIDLQSGFAHDEVIVRLAGAEVVHKRDVTTDYSVSLAASCPVEAPDGPVEVAVEVPSRSLKGVVELDAARTPYLGVAIDEGRLTLLPAETMFFYF